MRSAVGGRRPGGMETRVLAVGAKDATISRFHVDPVMTRSAIDEDDTDVLFHDFRHYRPAPWTGDRVDDTRWRCGALPAHCVRVTRRSRQPIPETYHGGAEHDQRYPTFYPG